MWRSEIVGLGVVLGNPSASLVETVSHCTELKGLAKQGCQPQGSPVSASVWRLQASAMAGF